MCSHPLCFEAKIKEPVTVINVEELKKIGKYENLEFKAPCYILYHSYIDVRNNKTKHFFYSKDVIPELIQYLKYKFSNLTEGDLILFDDSLAKNVIRLNIEHHIEQNISYLDRFIDLLTNYKVSDGHVLVHKGKYGYPGVAYITSDSEYIVLSPYFVQVLTKEELLEKYDISL